jgi:hypothetical protein
VGADVVILLQPYTAQVQDLGCQHLNVRRTSFY